MTPPLTPEEARKLADDYSPEDDTEMDYFTIELVHRITATLRLYADQADALTRLEAYEKAVGNEIEEMNEIANRAAKPGRDAEETCICIHGDLLDVLFRLRALQEK